MSDSKQMQIFLLEDDPVQLRLCTQILERGGYEVVSSDNPTEALNMIDAITPPDLILSDIQMPGMDGLVFMTHLLEHRRWCNVPVIMMTAQPTRDQLVVAQKVPVPPEAFLIKPVKPSEMIAQVKAVLAKEQPLYLLRSLQRRRLQLHLDLKAEQTTMDRSMSGAVHAIDAATTQVNEARKELQVLQRTRSLLGKESEDTRNAVEEQVKRLEDNLNDLKMQIDSYETERREVFARRHELVLTNQRELKALEERIKSVAEVVRLQSNNSGGSRAA